MKLLVRITAIFYFVAWFCFAQANTFRIATYNLLKFPGTDGGARAEDFRQVLAILRPDILVVQEMQSQAGVDMFVENIINNQELRDYKAATFVDGYDTDNAMFYNSARIEFVRNRQIDTNLREVSEYTVKLKNASSLPEFKFFSLHLKAGNTADDAARRLKDTQVLRTELNKLAAGSYFAVAGDFNLYTSTETAYQELVGSMDNNNGQCFDPANKPGEWHNNSGFAKWHTQSTRVGELGGGSTGGMDDRFDFILLSQAFYDSTDFQYVPNSYKAFGNDGLHFNYDINYAYNNVVGLHVATALYNASDHLPVCLDVVMNFPTDVEDNMIEIAENFELWQNFPNPFNNSTRIFINSTEQNIFVRIRDILGREVYSENLVSSNQQNTEFLWNGGDSAGNIVNSGVYFLTAYCGNSAKTIKMLYLR